MYTIGEFSKLTALTVKTLHHYHEKGLLAPARVDRQSGYRYYDRASVERARIIKLLRGLDLSLDEIGLILAECKDDGDALEFLERHRRSIEVKVRRYEDILSALDHVVAHEREAQAMLNHEAHIEEKLLPAQLVAGIRAHGRYDACGERFKRLGRAYGFALAGKPGNLVYDGEYKEEDADYESYFPIKRQKPAEGIAVHELPETRCLCLVHKGPYDEISRTYAKLLDALHERGLVASTPSREVYIKGPGMIFKGNPRRYLTEVQIPIVDASSAP
ncbi:MAG: MerR family transcriptional regulator [Sandaracinaceae bacterium]|nr:MerR family transcriptional regulator [Sandaracinaceae bacterium]